MEEDKYNKDGLREGAPWYLYHLLQMLRAIDYRFISPQAASRRVSYMYYEKYKRKDE